MSKLSLAKSNPIAIKFLDYSKEEEKDINSKVEICS
jgi:hypothetical protein